MNKLSSYHCSSPGLCGLVLVMMCLFTGLGYWQWQRAAEKEAVLATMKERTSSEALPLNTGLSEYFTQRYLPVTVNGQYLPDKQFLLDNQVQDGIPGYNILTPLQVEYSSKTVLVDRGWVVADVNRQILPNTGIKTTSVKLKGTLYVPFGEGFRLGSMDSDTRWPRVIQYLDFNVLRERLGESLLPVIVRLSPESTQGFKRQWKTVSFGPEKHLGYVVQWLALAIAMVIIFIMLIRPKNE